MLSKALGQYPEFRFQVNEKRLWNPILKKTFSDLPEERVRLSLVEYLTRYVNLSPSRISFESPVKLQGDKTSSRTDLIYYGKDFTPELLIECKAPEVKLSEKAAVQIARYNQKINAGLLMISNGITDYWFSREGDVTKRLEELPENFEPIENPVRDLAYWQNRAFIGQSSEIGLKEKVSKICDEIYSDPYQPVKYLTFTGYPAEYALNHFYRIFGLDEKKKLGLSFSATHGGDTRMNAILNNDGENVAFITSLIHSEGVFDTEIHSEKGVAGIDLNDKVSLLNESNFKTNIAALGDLLFSYT